MDNKYLPVWRFVKKRFSNGPLKAMDVFFAFEALCAPKSAIPSAINTKDFIKNERILLKIEARKKCN